MTPRPKEALRRRARLLLELGRPDEALGEISRALAEDPNDPECLEIAGICHLRRDDTDQALRTLGQALAADPESAHAAYLYGYALRQAQRTQAAEPHFRRALALQPDEPVYLRAWAELCADLGRHEEALEVAARAVAVAPERAANHVTYGYVASAAGKKPLARSAYERAVALDPADPAARNNLGCLDLAEGKVLQARLQFREALRLDPQGERAERNLRLVSPQPTRETPRTWPGTVEALVDELVRAGGSRRVILAVVAEMPAVARVLVRGGSTGAAASAVAVGVALRTLGALALVPLSVGAVAVGGAWWWSRHGLAEERQQVRRTLDEGQREFRALWQRWVAGETSRSTRDAAIDLLVERMAVALVST